jgi:hypothetical protein
MGMFDSFLVEIGGHEVELQTKRFDSVMACYRPGDVVSGATPGVQVLTDSLALDGDGRPLYGEAEGASYLTIFIVLGYGLYASYEAEPGALSEATTLARIRELAAEWDDSARLMTLMVQSIGKKQQRIGHLEGWLNYARSTVTDALRLRAGEQLPEPLFRDAEATRRLKAGEEPLEVLGSLLADEASGDVGLGFAGPFQLAESDPLAPYRL